MIRWLSVPALALAVSRRVAIDVAAEPLVMTFAGVARTGTDTRPVAFHFYCSSNNGPNVTGVLAVELEIPRIRPVARGLRFRSVRGTGRACRTADPVAHHGRAGQGERPLHRCGVDHSGRVRRSVLARGRCVAPGTRTVTQTRRRSAPVDRRSWAVGLAAGQRQTGGTPMSASLDLAPAQSDQLKSRASALSWRAMRSRDSHAWKEASA